MHFDRMADELIKYIYRYAPGNWYIPSLTIYVHLNCDTYYIHHDDDRRKKTNRFSNLFKINHHFPPPRYHVVS